MALKYPDDYAEIVSRPAVPGRDLCTGSTAKRIRKLFDANTRFPIPFYGQLLLRVPILEPCGAGLIHVLRRISCEIVSSHAAGQTGHRATPGLVARGY